MLKILQDSLMDTRTKIKSLMAEGMYDQEELFKTLYPYFTGHYSVLRRMIAEEKNNGAT
jgi:hypothetical protein